MCARTLACLFILLNCSFGALADDFEGTSYNHSGYLSLIEASYHGGQGAPAWKLLETQDTIFSGPDRALAKLVGFQGQVSTNEQLGAAASITGTNENRDWIDHFVYQAKGYSPQRSYFAGKFAERVNAKYGRIPCVGDSAGGSNCDAGFGTRGNKVVTTNTAAVVPQHIPNDSSNIVNFRWTNDPASIHIRGGVPGRTFDLTPDDPSDWLGNHTQRNRMQQKIYEAAARHTAMDPYRQSRGLPDAAMSLQNNRAVQAASGKQVGAQEAKSNIKSDGVSGSPMLKSPSMSSQSTVSKDAASSIRSPIAATRPATSSQTSTGTQQPAQTSTPLGGGVHKDVTDGRGPDGAIHIGGTPGMTYPNSPAVRTDTQAPQKVPGGLRVSGDLSPGADVSTPRSASQQQVAASSAPSAGGVRRDVTDGRGPDGAVHIGGTPDMTYPANPGVRTDALAPKQVPGGLRVSGDDLEPAQPGASSTGKPRDTSKPVRGPDGAIHIGGTQDMTYPTTPGISGVRQSGSDAQPDDAAYDRPSASLGSGTNISDPYAASAYDRPSSQTGSDAKEPRTQQMAALSRPSSSLNTPPGSPCLDYNAGTTDCGGKQPSQDSQDPKGSGTANDFIGTWRYSDSTCQSPIVISSTRIVGLFSGPSNSYMGASCSYGTAAPLQYPTTWRSTMVCNPGGVSVPMDHVLNRISNNQLLMRTCAYGNCTPVQLVRCN